MLVLREKIVYIFKELLEGKKIIKFEKLNINTKFVFSNKKNIFRLSIDKIDEKCFFPFDNFKIRTFDIKYENKDYFNLTWE